MSYAGRIGALLHAGHHMAEAIRLAAQIAVEADDEIASLRAANRDLQAWLDAASEQSARFEDAAIYGQVKTLKVSLPELAPDSWNEERACGWNMCLYTVRRLNGIKS